MVVATEEQTVRTRLPPGTVLGPDGKPCKICSSGFNAWTATQRKKSKKPKPGGELAGQSSVAGRGSGGESGTTSTSDALNAYSEETDSRRNECPADADRLGRHTWTFLHTTAAYYPEQPSATQKSSMLSLLTSLPTLYPCRNCADELGTYMKSNPPDQAIRNRTALGRWMCEVHNEVNERLGKDNFDCSNVDQRWKEGWSDGRCD